MTPNDEIAVAEIKRLNEALEAAHERIDDLEFELDEARGTIGEQRIEIQRMVADRSYVAEVA